MHSDGIWNDLELQRKYLKTTSLKHAFWRYLKRFGTAEKQMKTMTLNHAFWRIWNDSEPQKSFENNVSKACILTVFKTIWNCREHFENNVFKARIMVVSVTIWNCREIDENNLHLKHAFLRYLKRVWTVGKIWKHENKDAYACNVTRFDTIFWLADNILREVKRNGAFWRFYARWLLGDPIVLPIHPVSFFIANLDVLFFSFFSVGPGLLGI